MSHASYYSVSSRLGLDKISTNCLNLPFSYQGAVLGRHNPQHPFLLFTCGAHRTSTGSAVWAL